MTSQPYLSPGAAAATDAALVAAIAAGNLSSLGTLFDRHADDVRRFLVRLGVATGDVDDLVQQTFLDAVGAAPRFRPDAAARPWLFGLAAVVARRHRRFVRRMLARLERWRLLRVDEPAVTPSQRLELADEAQRAASALDTLSARKREAFVLVAVEGLSGLEAAAALDIPVATVWTRLHHARRELRLALGGGE